MLSKKSLSISSVKGFTLLEVLIAVVVFSVGLLGVAGLQILSLKLSHDSLLRTTATLLAKDMADRMRANTSQIELGIYSAYNNPNGISQGNPSCVSKDSNGNSVESSCAPQAMALHDFYEWNANVQGQASTAWHPEIKSFLPNAHGIVCIDSTPDDGLPPPNNPACDNITSAGKQMFAIKIWWSERKDSLDDPTKLHQFVMNVEL
ncbi:MAG TPA: type IV pilus modification protein PilV [Gammaproteobacteria bacterium]|nr:type IV pilus modification protein PilV [Gammaproteobacteria bacterium]